MEATKTQFNAPEVKLHFLDYWRIIRIRKTVIIAVFLLVALTTTLVTFILPESFRSTTRIAIDKDNTDVSGLAEKANTTPWDPFWIQTEFEKIQSKTILYQVVTNLGLGKKWAEKFKEQGELRTDVAYTILKGMIDVRQSRNTSLIEISVISEDKYEAAEIANKIAEIYRQYRLEVRREMSSKGILQLKEEQQQQTKKVHELQASADQLKTKLGISEIDAALGARGMTAEPENLRNLERQFLEAKADFKRIDAFYGYLTNLSRADFKKAILTASPDNQLGMLVDQQNVAEQQLARIVENLGPEHPDVRSLKRVLEQIERQVGDRLEGIITGLRAKRESELARLNNLQEDLDHYRNFDVKTQVDRQPYWQAKRQVENEQLILDKINLRVVQESIEAKLPKTGIVEVVDRAEPSFKAARPKKFLNITLGVVVGLAIGVGLAFFIEYLDTSVKTIDDVERALQAPVLGVIPQNVGSLIDEGPDSPHAEAYRVLRTNILFSQKDPKLNSITIVSGGAGEGKSTTTFNLATIFAQNNQRVLIVDSDLRRPSLHKLFKVSNSIGLTNYLLKQNTLEEVIQTSQLATLDFLPSGKLPSSSMGVLSSAQMKELIRDLKRRYDYVFFDSPPIMGVSDASILASEVDIVLQVIQYRRYPQPMTIRAKQMIEKVGGNLLGIVLNNINMASDENYYYYSGYYYDYYSKNDESKQEKDKDGRKASATKASAEEEDVAIDPKY